MFQEVGFKPTIFQYGSGILPLNRLYFKNNKYLNKEYKFKKSTLDAIL